MEIRNAAVAGLFYPADPHLLRATVESLLDAATPTGPVHAAAVLAPHAGYVYSGATAAHAYRALRDFDRAVILGPTHRVAVRGIALAGADAFATPLGTVPVAADDVVDLPGVVVRGDVHRLEHSLEVHLPFLQVLSPGASVLPLAVGDVAPELVADVVATVAQPGTVVIVSSDLSHYLPDDAARVRDAATIAEILALRPHLTSEDACGVRPLNGFLQYGRQVGLEPHLLQACNSSDTAGDPDRVVGYAAVAFTEGTP